MHRFRKSIGWLYAVALIVMAIFVVLAAYTNVPTAPNSKDELVFESLGFSLGSGLDASFDDQVALIRKVQFEIFKVAPLGAPIPDYSTREPADLIRHGQGQCYDRSRTLEKAFLYLGLESRHVFIIFKENLPFWRAVFKREQRSHAITEVKTSKGWLFVDSNMQWIALTRSGEPVDADGVWRQFSELDNPPPYLNNPWWAVRGMYSRKGQFYGAGIPFPEFNWHDFLTWFVLPQ
jgi:hypothetical protein